MSEAGNGSRTLEHCVMLQRQSHCLSTLVSAHLTLLPLAHHCSFICLARVTPLSTFRLSTQPNPTHPTHPRLQVTM